MPTIARVEFQKTKAQEWARALRENHSPPSDIELMVQRLRAVSALDLVATSPAGLVHSERLS